MTSTLEQWVDRKRGEKVKALVDVIDAGLRKLKTPPHSKLALGVVEAMSAKDWKGAAEKASRPVASAKTIECVIAVYHRRVAENCDGCQGVGNVESNLIIDGIEHDVEGPCSRCNGTGVES